MAAAKQRTSTLAVLWIVQTLFLALALVVGSHVGLTAAWPLEVGASDLLDGHGRPTSTTLYQGEQVAQILLAAEERFYGKDNRLLGNVRTWESDAGPTWGTLRVAAYDGKGRLMGLRSAEATDSNAVYDWTTWLGDPAHQSDLQDLQLDPKQTTNDVQLGGNWTAFTRNDLGTLTQVDVDDAPQWTASTFANGPDAAALARTPNVDHALAPSRSPTRTTVRSSEAMETQRNQEGGDGVSPQGVKEGATKATS